MKRYTLTSLALFIAMISLSWDTIAQATITFYDGSSTAYNCGTATGTLTASCFNCDQIICWQEGTYNQQTQVFTSKNQYTFNSADPTFHYNFTPISASQPDSRYYRVGYRSNGSSTTLYSSPFNVVAYPIPAAGTLSSSTTAGVNTASGQLTLTGATGTVTWYQVGSTTPLSLVNGNFNITQTTEFYASVSSAPCTVTSNHVIVTIYKPGILSTYIGGPTTPITVMEGNKVNMTVYIPGSSVQIQRWEYSIDGGSNWINFDYNSYFNNGGTQTGDKFSDTHEIWTNTKFRALVYMGPSLPAQYTNVLDAIFMPYTQGNPDPTNGGNYLREQTVTVSGISNPSLVDGLTGSQKHSITSFQDGKGRVVQQNFNSGSAKTQSDIIKFSTYNRLGRQATNYLPYLSYNSDGAYRINPVSEQANFYLNGTGDQITDSAYPYATTIFEKSPLQKVTEQGGVGQSWQPGSGHSVVPTYSNNDVSNQIRLILADGTSSQYYNDNELSLTDIADADGKHTQTLKNKEGRTIVSRTQLDVATDGVPWAETYYVYATNGAVKYIISPKGVAALKAGSWSLTSTILDQYVHQFTYDALGRLVERKVPGQAPFYYCYDRFDRVVLMQDANTRPLNKWVFFKYDRDGRTVMNGLYTNMSYTSRTSMQTNVIDPLYATVTDPYFEERGSAAHGYTNQSFPISAIEVHNVNYYDDYDLDNDGVPNAVYQTQGIAGEGTAITNTALLPTASKRLVLDGGSTWLYSFVFYDIKGRTIQIQSNNHLSSTVNNIVTNTYDFEGKLVMSKTYHDAGSNRNVTTTNSVQYDPAGRTTGIFSSSSQPVNQQGQQPFTSSMVGQPVQWTNIVGVTQSGNTLTKTGGTNGAWDAGAFSIQAIPDGKDGWIEFSCGETNNFKMAGLSATDGGPGYTTINYALYPAADGNLYIYENGTLRSSTAVSYTTSDALRVERIGTTIVYKKNGVVFYTSPVASTGPLYADCSLHNSNCSLTNISLGIGRANNVNVTLSGNILTKTAGAGAAWDAGAFSTQSIPDGKDGWIEFTCGETNTYKMMGLSTTDGDAGYATINYALYPSADGNLYVYENGTGYLSPLGTYTTTDVLRVERSGMTILYKKNNAVIFTSAIPSSGSLYADCSIFNMNATIRNISMGTSLWNHVNVTATGSTLTKTGGTNNVWNAGSFSVQSIPTNTNGFVEFTAGETNSNKAMGLSATNTNEYFNTINYALLADATGKLNVYENGVSKASAVASYVTTDILRVERTGTSIVYKKNGSILYTSATPSTSALYADCSFNTVGSTIKNIAMGINGIQIASYQYNELGQLVDKKLHSTDGTNFLQSVDFRYNINGKLTSINNAQLGDDHTTTNTNDETNDYFGMELLYETVDNNLGTTANYNGNISAVKWKGIGTATGSDNIHGYKYTYDNANRLTLAASSIYTASANAWNKEVGVFNENMTYDLNGNIRTLQRNTRKNQALYTYVSQSIDNLTYVYNPTMGDQLLQVTDATSNAGGFDNGSSGTNNDYTYDANGNLLSDQNKGIGNIVYNHLGKPTSVVYTDGRRVDYTYDATGTKLTMKAYASGGTLQTTTDYANSFVYVNNQLSFYGSPEGRVVNNNGNLEYQYAIADHQGNTRVVFTSVNPTTAPVTATFENAVADSKVFQNVNTSSMYSVSKSGANNTSGGQYVMRMNSTYPAGPAKSLKVFPGDVVNMEVWSYFEGSSGFGASDQPLTALITAVASAFGGVSGAAGESGAIYNGVNAAYAASGAPTNQSDAVPTAHLNYILFDQDYNLLDMGWQNVPSTANFSKQKITFASPINIKEAGYMYVYLSYEGTGTNWVYFDDLKITHTKTNVIQYNEYYPYGLQANTSWTRNDATANNFLYNEASEINTTTGWYDLPFRNYDATIGRMMQVDPMATKNRSYGSYNYGFNNPILLTDPSGADPPAGPQGPPGIEHMGGYTDDNGEFHWYDPTGYAAAYAALGMENTYTSLIQGNAIISMLGKPKYEQNSSGQWGYWVDSPLEDEAGVSTKFVLCPECAGEMADNMNAQIPGAELIEQYEKNEILAFAMQFTGEAFLENGVGGDHLKKIRKAFVESQITKPNMEGLKRGSDIMDIASGFVKIVLSFTKPPSTSMVTKKDSFMSEAYVSGVGALLILGSGVVNYKNEQLAEKIREVNPEYYNHNIENIYDYQGGGGGSSDDW